MRNNRGDLIYALAETIRFTTTVMAEVWAIYEVVYFCKRKGFSRIIIETDSLRMRNIINEVWEVS